MSGIGITVKNNQTEGCMAVCEVHNRVDISIYGSGLGIIDKDD